MMNEEAIKKIKDILEEATETEDSICYVTSDDADALKAAIQALKQQPKTGKWLDKKTTIKGGHGLAYGRYGCSVCKKKQPSKTDFCPCCGADMRGDKNDG